MININLCRQEKRFFLPGDRIEALSEMLREQNFVQRKFPHEVVQTVYFLDDWHTQSCGISFKARRYMSDFSTAINLEKLWQISMLWEMKWEGNKHELREKSDRVEATLQEIGVLINERSACPLRPFMIVEYQRKHFDKKGMKEQFRITVDAGTRFWFFPKGETTAVEVGDSAAASVIRVELKFDAELLQSEQIQQLIRALEKKGSMPLISKKGDGLNFVKWWHDRKYGNPHLKKELGESEIESKISVTGFDFDQLCVALRMFCASDVSPMKLDSTFPFVLATTTINHYWVKAHSAVEGFKVLTRSGMAKSMCKSDHEVLDAKLGILERAERKGVNTSCTEESIANLLRARVAEVGPLTYVGCFLRVRKAFWVVSPENRLYHVSLERCVAEKRPVLEQIEIEYTGLRIAPTKLSDNLPPKIKIVRDIQDLTLSILAFLNKIGGEGRSVTALGEEKCAWLTGRV